MSLIYLYHKKYRPWQNTVKKLTDTIVEYIEDGMSTISEICSFLHISRKTYYHWLQTKPEFAQAITKAEEHRDADLADKARIMLKQRIEGYTKKETITKYIVDEYGELIIKEKIIKQKEGIPSIKAIKYALEREDRKKAERQSETKKPERQPLHITVMNQKQKEAIQLLQKNGGRPDGWKEKQKNNHTNEEDYPNDNNQQIATHRKVE